MSPGRFTQRGLNAEGGCSGQRGNVFGVGKYCYVASARRRARRLGAHGGGGAGDILCRHAQSLFRFRIDTWFWARTVSSCRRAIRWRWSPTMWKWSRTLRRTASKVSLAACRLVLLWTGFVKFCSHISVVTITHWMHIAHCAVTACSVAVVYFRSLLTYFFSANACFYRASALFYQFYLSVCLSVCPSVCLFSACTVLKRMSHFLTFW